jgi:hypothetical protein
MANTTTCNPAPSSPPTIQSLVCHSFERIISLHNTSLLFFRQHHYQTTRIILTDVLRQIRSRYTTWDSTATNTTDMETTLTTTTTITSTTTTTPVQPGNNGNNNKNNSNTQSCRSENNLFMTNEKVYVTPKAILEYNQHPYNIFPGLFCLNKLFRVIFMNHHTINSSAVCGEDIIHLGTAIALYNMGITTHLMGLQQQHDDDTNNQQSDRCSSPVLMEDALMYYERAYGIVTMMIKMIPNKDPVWIDRTTTTLLLEFFHFVSMALCMNMTMIRTNSLRAAASVHDQPMIQQFRRTMKTTIDFFSLPQVLYSSTLWTIQEISFFRSWYRMESCIDQDSIAAVA